MKLSKKLWHSFALAMSMYARIPMPMVEWAADSMSYLFCFFPCVGVVCGGGLALVLLLCKALALSRFFSAALCVLLPLAITGGIHLDGFCDTCDALGSHRSREEKLEILKDSHIGAFALIGCACYLLLLTAVWQEVSLSLPTGIILCLIPVLSRTLSGLCAVTMKNARGSGLLATFTDASACRAVRITLAIWLIGVSVGMLAANLAQGLGCLFGGALMLLYYRRMAHREFGGITGDLEGWFLQLCELCCLFGVVLVQKLEVLL
jgi:adenosylcobinamide-GDP ribazoletransferase